MSPVWKFRLLYLAAAALAVPIVILQTWRVWDGVLIAVVIVLARFAGRAEERASLGGHDVPEDTL